MSLQLCCPFFRGDKPAIEMLPEAHGLHAWLLHPSVTLALLAVSGDEMMAALIRGGFRVVRTEADAVIVADAHREGDDLRTCSSLLDGGYRAHNC